MKRLIDVLGLAYILLVALLPNLAWPATPAPSPTPACQIFGKLYDDLERHNPIKFVCEAPRGWTRPTPSPTPHHWLCFRDAFSDDGVVPEQPIGCVPSCGSSYAGRSP